MLNNVVGYLSESGDLYSACLIFGGGGLIFGVSICGGSIFRRGAYSRRFMVLDSDQTVGVRTELKVPCEGLLRLKIQQQLTIRVE
jgi:hypothetical protein